MTLNYDVLIIGSGAAGLGLALSIAHQGKIAIITKGPLMAGASPHAQGGIAAVMSQEDSYESHIHDTLVAGAGLCDLNVVEFVVRNAKSAIQWLIQQGVEFTKTEDQDFHLTREGGHSYRRILHATDKTGAVVVRTLAEQVNNHPNIDCYTEHTAIDLILDHKICVGVDTLDNEKNTLKRFTAKIIVLATGGASSAYLHTSNFDDTYGDGIAMGWRAGCRVANLEFNQFHPTCLYYPPTHHSDHHRPFLITEAIRGEGGFLVLPNGKRFMPSYDERAELAPRDIVARAIDAELKSNHIDCVYLDITHKPTTMIKNYFPTIYQHCLNINIDITKDPIPVIPAAHYTCGGIMTDLHGQTDIKNLYAVGEVAWTGLHGANRMASNSLLECLVFAMSAAKKIIKELPEQKLRDPMATIALPQSPSLAVDKNIFQLRKIMWDYVGIVRSNERLEKAKLEIDTMKTQAPLNSINFRNLITVCDLIVRSALARKESRGLHYNVDYPHLDNKLLNTILD